jgi:hypothetical protein
VLINPIIQSRTRDYSSRNPERVTIRKESVPIESSSVEFVVDWVYSCGRSFCSLLSNGIPLWIIVSLLCNEPKLMILFRFLIKVCIHCHGPNPAVCVTWNCFQKQNQERFIKELYTLKRHTQHGVCMTESLSYSKVGLMNSVGKALLFLQTNFCLMFV